MSTLFCGVYVHDDDVHRGFIVLGIFEMKNADAAVARADIMMANITPRRWLCIFAWPPKLFKAMNDVDQIIVLDDWLDVIKRSF